MNLTKKLTIFFILTFLLPAIIISIIGFTIEKNNLTKRVTMDMATLAEVCGKQFSLYFERHQIRTADWSSDGKIRNDAEQIISNPPSLAAPLELSEYLKNKKLPLDSSVLLITIHNLEGAIIASSNPELIGKYQEKETAAKALNLKFGEAAIINIERNPEHKTEEILIHVASPLYSLNNTLIGVIINHINHKTLDSICKTKNYLEESYHAEHLEQYLIDKNGTILTSSVYLGKDVILKQKVAIPNLDSCFKENKLIYGEWTNYVNKKVFGAVTLCSKDYDYAVVSEIAKDTILKDIYNLASLIVIISFVFIIIITAVAIILARNKVNQIKSNLDALTEIGKNNFETRISIKSKDEIGQAAQKINEVAERLQAFATKIKQAEKGYKNLIDSLPFCIKWLDAKGNMLFINKAGMEEHFLKTQEEAMKWNYLDTINPAFKETAAENMQKALKGESRQIEFMHTPEGSTHEWCQSWLKPLLDENGKQNGLLFISSDATERKKMEEKNKDLDELKNKFIQIISHQMRTPLNVIRWTMETILGGTLGEITSEQKNMLKNSYDADLEIIQRIDDLVNTLDIEEGRIILKKGKYILDSLVESVVIEHEKSIRIKKLKFNFKKSAKKIELEIDPIKIKNTIFQLLDNAIKYTHEGGEITVNIEEKDEELYFTITDNGIGIPSDEQDKIFTKFYRATNAFTMSPDASGLGLFISKALIEVHGGKIWFNSHEGKGSEFYFKLPINK